MFSDVEQNKCMLFGAYKKLKSYYHYNKNFIFIKKKIAEFEYDEDCMQEQLLLLANILSDLDSNENKEIVKGWIDEISFYVMPKAFTSKTEKDDLFIRCNESEDKAVNKVNFFINMNIQLHLLETLWTVLLGKIVFDHGLITEDCYGNCIDDYVVYNKQDNYLDSINFQKNKLFKIYFNQYCRWKNNAIEEVINVDKRGKDSVLFSLDIKSYYYSVIWEFIMLKKLFPKDERLNQIQKLTNVIEEIFCKYTQILKEYRTIKSDYQKHEYVLPIGMFSSMLLGNIYLSEFDKKIRENPNVLYYGRYVDDMLLLLDVAQIKESLNSKEAFDICLLDENKVLEKNNMMEYSLYKYSNLVIQREKVKIIFFEYGKAGALIKQLKKVEIIPSQMNIIPQTDLKMEDFEEAAYVIKNFTNETKIRDIGQIEVDRFQLGWHMSQMVRNSRLKKDLLTVDERKERYLEGRKILNFFQQSKALEHSNNWINALYFFMLTCESNKGAWKDFEKNVRDAIKKVRIERLDGIQQGKSRTIKAKMKKCLTMHFDICVAMALAINPRFSNKEKSDILNLAIRLRQANLFNHYLVSMPLINYADNLDENVDLTNVDPAYIKTCGLVIYQSRKSKLSPRFVNLDEIFHYTFYSHAAEGGNYFLDSERRSAEDKIKYIEQYFFEINNINISTAIPMQINIKNEIMYDKYYLQKIQLGQKMKQKDRVKIAIANIKLDTRRCCLGLRGMDNVLINRNVFIQFLKKSYTDYNEKVDFLLLPEFYLPLQWISDVLNFTRRTGVTVISGLQYVTCDEKAYNNVALFLPVSVGRYRNAIMFVREKNDYAPMEEQLLALKKYICENQKIPSYQIINNNGIEYGVFLCYEFTDIMARSLYKNNVDILFTPEHNKDTAYFSNIIETTTRDLHAFIVQANTSVYGDSRIVGPYSRNDRNIVQIKGGECDDIIIGTINLKEIRDYQLSEDKRAKDQIEKYLHLSDSDSYNKLQKIFGEVEKKISKTSARFNSERLL